MPLFVGFLEASSWSRNMTLGLQGSTQDENLEMDFGSIFQEEIQTLKKSQDPTEFEQQNQ